MTSTYEPDRIFVGGLPNTVDSNEKLQVFFQQFGPVREAKVFVDLQTGRPKGFGFIRFEHGASVEAAIANDAQNVLDGKWVSVKRCEIGSGKQPGGAPVKWQGAANSVEDAGLWVRGLPLEYTDSSLKQFFDQYGQVVDCKVLPRRYPNNPDQAGLVRMASPDQAQWCVDNLNNTTPAGYTMAMTVRRSNKSAGTKADQPNAGVNALGALGHMGSDLYASVEDGYGAWSQGGLQQAAPQTVFNSVDPYLQAALHPQTAAPQPVMQLQEFGAPAPPIAPMQSALPQDPPSSRLWVKGLPLGYTDNHLRELFSAYGTVVDCQSLPGKFPELDGVVCMQGLEAAQLAVATLNGRIPMGFADPISVVYAKETSSIDGTAPIAGAVQQTPVVTQPDYRVPATVGTVPPLAQDPLGGQQMQDGEWLTQAINMVGQTQPVSNAGVHVQPPPHRLQALGLQAQPPPPQPPPQPQQQAQPLQSLMGSPPKMQEMDRIFVGGLPQTCDMETLALFFSQFGGIKEATVNTDQATGRSKGFGFVRFVDPSSVELALLNDVNNIISGKHVTVKRAEAAAGSGPTSGAGGASTLALTTAPMSVLDGNANDTGLWIRGLPLHFTEASLKAFFEQYVQVIDCKVLPRKFPENPDQAGLVRVATTSMAKWCIDSLNGTTPPGFPIPVTIKLSTSTAPQNKQGGQGGGAPQGSSQSIAPLTASQQAGLDPNLAAALAVGSNLSDPAGGGMGAATGIGGATGYASSISPLMPSDPALSGGAVSVDATGGVKRPADGWADDEASKYLKM